MKKIFLSLLVALAFVAVSLTLVKADAATTVDLAEGVQIRTDGNNGLRWVANVTNHNDSNVYGFLFAQGDVANLTAETNGVINQVVTGVDAENLSYSATMVKFPQSAAGQDISVRAYVKVGNTYTYSSNTVVRNLGEVALTAYNTDAAGTFVKNVVNFVESNYKTLYVGFDGAVNFGVSKYEINPANLEKEFVKDWNAKFGTTWTEFNYKDFDVSAIEGTAPLTATTDTDCSGTNAYEFFNTDPVTSAKWDWLLEFFLGETATGVHSKLQINALLGNGTYEVDNNGTPVTQLWKLMHFSRSLHNFFSAGYENVHDYPGVAFPDSSAFAQIGKYNDQIIASNPKLVMIGKEVELSDLINEGYNFEGYDSGSGVASTTVKVPTETVSYAPQFAPVCYTIKYMYGEVELTDLERTYNIEDDFHLPESVFDGYDLLGWYDNPELTGDPIEMIEVGTTGDKVYYAKVEQTTHVNVNVTFDANGGRLPSSYVAGDFELEVEKYAANGYASDVTYMLPYITPGSGVSTLKFQYKVLLNYDSTLGLYKVVAVDAATKALADAANGATWTHAIANSKVSFTGDFAVGQYVYIDVDALKTAPQVAKVYNSLDSLTNYTTTLKKPGTLPVPTNGSESFTGWRSSLDGSIIKEYPGYMENPGDITYTAVWSAEINANVTFDFNGGNTKYATREAMVEDFLTDAMTKFGKTSKPDGVHTNVSPTTVGFANVFSAIYDIFVDETYAAKWAWLKDYVIAATDVANTKTQLEAGNDQFWRYSLGAFLFKQHYTSYPASEDFTVEAKYNGFWDELSTAETTNYTITNESSLISKVYKTGYTFDGWYDTNGNLYDSVSDFLGVYEITLTAKFTKIVTYGTISYQVNGGELPEGAATKYVEGEEFTLPVPTKQDYTFLGWSLTSGSTSYITAISASTTGAVTVYANWVLSNISAGVTFDYNGGVSEKLIKANGSVGSLIVSNYGGNFWDLYASNTFVYVGSTNYNPQGAKRIYIAKNASTGFYEILGVQTSGVSSKPTGTEYILTVSDSYTGTYADNLNISALEAGDYVFFDKAFTGASSSNLVTFTFYKGTLATTTINQTISSSVVFDTPIKEGYKFSGWYDANGNLYDSYTDFAGIDKILVTAKYTFDDTLIGSFETNSWVVVGKTIKLNHQFVSGSNISVTWKSSTPSIAEVDSEGNVTGLAEGLATIVVYATEAPTIKFTFYVTVVTEASGAWLVILESNNEDIFIRENLGIGAGTPEYYTDIYGSVSQLLFANYYENTAYYLSSPTKTTTMSSVEFVTFHYAADMPQGGTAYKTGGKNLAAYQQTASGVSYHYATGMDGIYACANTKWGAWHAGSNKTLYWYDSGLTTSDIGTDVYTTDVTLKNGYFYIKGKKTSVANSTGYTKLNKAGLAVKLSGTKWYIGGCYYNSSYGYISSQGGNGNSIGIESSVRKLSDSWLTWQYSAQLCAKLLIEFGLPIQRLVPHHFFSGKDCPQPLLANELEIWYIFVEMVEQEMAYFKANGSTKSSPKAGGTAPTFSESSSYIGDKGRVTSLPTYSTCQTYTVTYGGKTRTLSVIIPGTVA